MIDPKYVITYSQYNEDIILRALLHGVKRGFYVDVGANDPEADSVTKIFYDSGWSGINIEPIDKYYRQYKIKRKRDINLRCGIGKSEGEIDFIENIDIPGHSTFSKDQSKHFKKNYKIKTYKIPIKTLTQVFSENNIIDIDFLKIDVEGFEYDVILGNDWQKYRPKVICIESNHTYKNWKSVLLDNGYKLFVSDALNEYYIDNKYWSITVGYEERAVSLSYHALKRHQYYAWNEDSNNIIKLQKHAKSMAKIIEEQNAQNTTLINKYNKSQTESYSDRRYLGRLRVALYSLTIGYIKYKKKNKK